jgi:hypothetical protein
MSEIKIQIKMSDGSRKEGLDAPADQHVSELLKAVIKHWGLDPATNYAIVNETKGNAPLQFNQSLAAQNVGNGDTLAVQPEGIGG